MQKFRSILTDNFLPITVVASNFKATRSFTQICNVVMCHQYGISALVPQMPFCGGEDKTWQFWTGFKIKVVLCFIFFIQAIFPFYSVKSK